jgi:hypothetical protein
MPLREKRVKCNFIALKAHFASGVRVLACTAAVACGSGGSHSNPTEPDETLACVGKVSDSNGDSTPLPGGPGPAGNVAPLDICVSPTATTVSDVTQCQSQCTGALSTYASLIDASLPPGTPSVQVSQLTCSISNVEVVSTMCPDPPTPLSGGPAQYVANLSGSVNVSVDTGTPLGTISTSTGASGQMGYAILPPTLECPPQGCELVVTGFNLAVGNFSLGASFLGITIFNDSVTSMSIQNDGWITGTWQPNGQFNIPGGAAQALVNLEDNGTATSFDQATTAAITGTIDPVAGTVSFDSFSETQGSTTFTTNSLSGSNFVTPPVAVITLPTTIECNRTNAASVILNGTASTSQNDDLHFFGWTVNGGPVLSGATVPAVLQLGVDEVALTVFNSAFGVGLASETVDVLDTIPPSFAPIADVTDTLCNPDTQAARVPAPVATDICSPTVIVTGAIIAANGKPLSPPLALLNGAATVSAGTYVVQWTATDQSGNFSTATQTLTVRPGVEATNSISIDDRAVVQIPGGTPSEIANTGTGLVTVGGDAKTGDVLTEGSVFLRNGAIVQGNIEAGGTLTEQTPSTITGTTNTGSPVPIPLPPPLGVTFPTSFGPPVDLEPGAVGTITPGSYVSIAVKSRAVLTLSTGTYFFGSLDLEPQATLDLNQVAGPVAIYVQSLIIDRGVIQTVAGVAGNFVFGYAGSSTFFIQSPFPGGTVIAPNSDVVISSFGTQSFVGELFAQSIEVQPGATLTCDPDSASGSPAGATSGAAVTPLDMRLVSSPVPSLEVSSEEAGGGGCSVSDTSAKCPCSGAVAAGIMMTLGMFARRRRREGTQQSC